MQTKRFPGSKGPVLCIRACSQDMAYYGTGKEFNEYQLLDFCVILSSSLYIRGPRQGQAISPSKSEPMALNFLKLRMAKVSPGQSMDQLEHFNTKVRKAKVEITLENSLADF